MASRLILQEELESVLGRRNVYYNPPENKKLSFPCIVYNNEKIDSTYANNGSYLLDKRYQIMLIDDDPESDFETLLFAQFPTISHDRTYVSEGLYHYVFTLYY